MEWEYIETKPAPAFTKQEMANVMARVVPLLKDRAEWARARRSPECARGQHGSCGQFWYQRELGTTWRAPSGSDVYLMLSCYCTDCRCGAGDSK